MKIRIFISLILFALAATNSFAQKKVIREDIEWCDYWWENEPDTSKPRILFLGNSVTRGYFPMVSKNLREQVNCDRFASSRSITDPALLKETKMAMGKYNHSIIHFNNGLHGWNSR